MASDLTPEERRRVLDAVVANLPALRSATADQAVGAVRAALAAAPQLRGEEREAVEGWVLVGLEGRAIPGSFKQDRDAFMAWHGTDYRIAPARLLVAPSSPEGGA